MGSMREQRARADEKTSRPQAFSAMRWDCRRWVALAAVAIHLVGSVRGDSWSIPRQFEAKSENERFKVIVEPGRSAAPGDYGARGKLRVLSIDPVMDWELWSSELCNEVSPVAARVSNDGTAVVTLDNWFKIGYGPDVVAIYSTNGLLAKYALEEFAPLPRRRNAEKEVFRWPEHGDLFLHTTSSRHWRQNSFDFFYTRNNELLFCLWLDWDTRWVVWGMRDGKVKSIGDKELRDINREGRRRARMLASAEARTYSMAGALSFLGWLKNPEDRPMLEESLRDSVWSVGRTMTGTYSYTAISPKRDLADRALARWEGQETPFDPFGFGTAKHRLLGAVHGSISFSAKLSGGYLRVYLIPKNVAYDHWDHTKPEHHFVASIPDLPLESPHPASGEDYRVNWEILGVTPGSFRVKVVWDRAEPWAAESSVLCQPGPGDYESIESPVIEVVKGQTTEVEIECKTPVERKR
jgi:hypothetical protein